MNLKPTVILRGPLLTQSGYGVHARQIASWLLQKKDITLKVILTPWGDTSWFVNPNDLDGLVGKIMNISCGPEAAIGSDVSIQLQLPNEWDPNLSKVNVGVSAMVETDRCNPEWVAACNKMSMIIVPSKHAKSSITNSGELTVPIHVVPESYTDAIDHVDTTSVEMPTFSTKFNFLIFGQLTGNNPNNDRKNIFNTIKWISESFANDSDVGIVIKTNASKNSKIDRSVVTNIMKQLLAEVRKTANPKLHLVHGDMYDNEVVSLYKHPQIKAIVSLTRGEGYGLPLLEAAAVGLPVIATGWSGHTEFLNHGKFVNIHYQLKPIHSSRIDNKIFMNGSRWAEPSEEDFKKRITKFRNFSETPLTWAKDLSLKIKNQYSHKNICELYDTTFKGIL